MSYGADPTFGIVGASWPNIDIGQSNGPSPAMPLFGALAGPGSRDIDGMGNPFFMTSYQFAANHLVEQDQHPLTGKYDWLQTDQLVWVDKIHRQFPTVWNIPLLNYLMRHNAAYFRKPSDFTKRFSYIGRVASVRPSDVTNARVGSTLDLSVETGGNLRVHHIWYCSRSNPDPLCPSVDGAGVAVGLMLVPVKVTPTLTAFLKANNLGKRKFVFPAEAASRKRPRADASASASDSKAGFHASSSSSSSDDDNAEAVLVEMTEDKDAATSHARGVRAPVSAGRLIDLDEKHASSGAPSDRAASRPSAVVEEDEEEEDSRNYVLQIRPWSSTTGTTPQDLVQMFGDQPMVCPFMMLGRTRDWRKDHTVTDESGVEREKFLHPAEPMSWIEQQIKMPVLVVVGESFFNAGL